MQLQLPSVVLEEIQESQGTYQERLGALLESDLDFHAQGSGYATHNLHSFPAKFPPQLPRKFILALTEPGDVVLDPMMGSGTTVVEAFLTGRQGVGTDIDPMALLIARAKTTALDPFELTHITHAIVASAGEALRNRRDHLQQVRTTRWDGATSAFLDYWFASETQLELLALLLEVEQVANADAQAFFKLVFSSTIITKSGGVSLAFDLAHTRPHRAKVVLSPDGQILFGQELAESENRRVKFLTKTLRSPLDEFTKRARTLISSVATITAFDPQPGVLKADAQRLPLGDGVVDLIVTSPPYAANAIDYMRAHKFSLVWFGFPVGDLSEDRGKCIGGESAHGIAYEPLPPYVTGFIAEIAGLDRKKGLALQRYYSEMTRVLREMYRVLRRERAAIVVVGSSMMRGRDTETHLCLKKIGESLGFQCPRIGVRQLDRDRRMMPAGATVDSSSMIQQRMHQEYVIGFYKP